MTTSEIHDRTEVYHDSPRWDPEQDHYQEDFGDYSTGFPWGFLRPPGPGAPPTPVDDPVVNHWAKYTEPFLTATHDKLREGLASFFDRSGGWLPISQDAIARATHLHRKTVNRLLPDLIAVGNIERRDRTHGVDGKRECEYRLAGEVTNWKPLYTGHQERETVESYLGRRETATKVEELESLVLDLFALTVVTDVPDNVITILEGIYTRLEDKKIPSFAGVMTNSTNDNYRWDTDESQRERVVADSQAGSEPRSGRWQDQATQSQLMKMVVLQDEKGLSDDDVLASWPEFMPRVPPPVAIDPSCMSKFDAHRTIRWLQRQPDQVIEEPAPEPRPDAVCCCPGDTTPEVNISPDLKAEATWAASLEQLEMELPRATFETWLTETRGLGFEGMDLVVGVPSDFNIEWLEQRLYQTILRALRQSSGALFDVRFAVAVDSRICPVHGDNSGKATSGGEANVDL